MDEMDAQMAQLVSLLPDLTLRLDRMKAELLMQLLTGQDRIAGNLLALRRRFPAADAGSIVSRCPALLTSLTADQIERQADCLRDLLPDTEDLDSIVHAEPRLLLSDIAFLLAEARRLLPDRDPQTFLAQNPGKVVEMLLPTAPPTLGDEYAL